MKHIVTLLLLVFTLGATAQAQDAAQKTTSKQVKKQKSKKQKEEKVAVKKNEPEFVLTKVPGKKVYIFGVGYHFGDSTVYVTNIEEVDSIALQEKTKFLPYRSEFSLQLRQYLEGMLEKSHMTCCVFFSEKREKLLKTFNKAKSRYLNTPGSMLKIIGEEDFKFKHPLDVM